MNENWMLRSFGPERFVVLRFDWSLIGKRSDSLHESKGNESVETIVDRLASIVGEYRASARRVGTPIDGHPLRDIVRALRIESLGEDPGDLLRTADPTETYFRESLYWELLEVSGRLLPPVAAGTASNHPHSDATTIWRESLLCLEARLDLL